LPAAERRWRSLCGAFAAVLISICWNGPAMAEPVRGESQMIVAANPLAAEAGLNILRAGGTAVDAAIAAALLLGLVEPQSSGIGGGGFMLHYTAKARRIDAYDGRETAPAAAGPKFFLNKAGEPLPFWDAVVGGRSVGVPGLLRLAKLAHNDHGRLPWAALFQPAIVLAESGFPVSPRLHRLIAEDNFLKRQATAARYFYRRDGKPLPVGTLLKNPDYAETLRKVALGGPTAFYSGDIAKDIVATLRNAKDNPGVMNLRDLEGYRAKRRLALCTPYRNWRVCGMPPPTSGGVAVLQAMGILAQFDLAGFAPNAPAALHLITEASRLAFADRNQFLADPDFVDVPVQRLLDPIYLRRRAALISPERSLGQAVPGFTWDKSAIMPAQHDPPSTTHLSVVDQWGNAVALTASIESAFGSRLMVRGFLLNNELTDFAFQPEVDERPVANRVQGGKRPRSSMAPTMVLDRQGRLVLVIGSPGGSRIIGYVLQSLVAALDWGLDMEAVTALPHAVNRNGATELETGKGLHDAAEGLKERGHEVKFVPMTSGLNGIRIEENQLSGGADPRREGVVLAD
jgi:gamma-glutamyltranspeptidase/glutathione hydrolase